METPTGPEIEQIAHHLQAFSDPLELPEQMMLDRIRAGHWTEFEQRFFEHERREAALLQAGESYDVAHRRVLEEQGIAYEPGYEAYMYHPDVVLHDITRLWFNNAARERARRMAEEREK